MNNDELTDLSNVLNNTWGLDTIYRILTELGAFETGINRQSTAKEDYLILGKREKGAWLLNCVYKANKNKYLEILKRKEN